MSILITRYNSAEEAIKGLKELEDDIQSKTSHLQQMLNQTNGQQAIPPHVIGENLLRRVNANIERLTRMISELENRLRDQDKHSSAEKFLNEISPAQEHCSAAKQQLESLVNRALSLKPASSNQLGSASTAAASSSSSSPLQAPAATSAYTTASSAPASIDEGGNGVLPDFWGWFRG